MRLSVREGSNKVAVRVPQSFARLSYDILVIPDPFQILLRKLP